MSDNYDPRPIVFSTEDGLYLSVFLAVSLVLGIVARFICRRYCPGRCQPKQSDNHDSSMRRPSMEGRRTSIGGMEAAPRPRHKQEARTLVMNGNNSVLSDPSAEEVAENVRRAHLAGRRESHISMIVPQMQTVVEEEEETDEEVPQVTVTMSRSMSEPSPRLQHTVYTFQGTVDTGSQSNTQSSSETSSITAETSLPTSSNTSTVREAVSVSPPPHSDPPPKYDDLFPRGKITRLNLHHKSNTLPEVHVPL